MSTTENIEFLVENWLLLDLCKNAYKRPKTTWAAI